MIDRHNLPPRRDIVRDPGFYRRLAHCLDVAKLVQDDVLRDLAKEEAVTPTSDQASHLRGLRAQLEVASQGLGGAVNLLKPTQEATDSLPPDPEFDDSLPAEIPPAVASPDLSA